MRVIKYAVISYINNSGEHKILKSFDDYNEAEHFCMTDENYNNERYLSIKKVYCYE